ncbi:MAG: polyamine aminopropyltransferase [Polyangiaceae bacterium]|nr:polyamine aminopropyltransferase [Polyangiaceae bacterium]
MNANERPASTAPIPPPGWRSSAGREERPRPRLPSAALLGMVLVIATAGLVYELAMAAVASYVLGDSVRQYSLVIGLYLSALGLGAWLSRFVTRRLEETFVDVELAAALVGGLSAPGLFLAFSLGGAFELVLYSMVVVVGALVGLELPLLMRILEGELELKELLARALGADYVGALAGSIGFSLVLVPAFGLARSTVVCGLLNGAVALASTWLLDPAHRARVIGARLRAIAILAVLGAALAGGSDLVRAAESRRLDATLLESRETPYQRITLLDRRGTIELHLNGHLQFSSLDEHRYHEALVHPAVGAAERRARVLVGGGGDGLAVREILAWPEVREVVLVDLDPEVTRLARAHPRLRGLNRGALDDPRVRVLNLDAMRFFAEDDGVWDVIVLDFPDPSSYAVGKLFSTRFYATVRERLAATGALVVQSTSPFLARRTFWCVVETLEAVGFTTRPYHAFVPSFGEWGFVLARLGPFPEPSALPPAPLRFLEPGTLRGLFHFADDMARVPAGVNRLDNQRLVGLYLSEWSRFL